MSNSPVASREAALRIALAAHTLDQLDVRALVNALAERLGLPLTAAKLARLTVDDLRAILAGDHAEENCIVGVAPKALKTAVRQLWGEGIVSDLPQVETDADLPLPGSIRVAVASNRDEELDGHFGSCERFLIYQVSPERIKLVDVRCAFDADSADDRNAARAALIADCRLVFVQSIGGPAAAKVVRRNVHPLKKPAGGPARELLAELQPRLRQPPPWLAHILGVPAASLKVYADALAAEEA